MRLNENILKHKKVLLFDLDGTILDDSNIWDEIYAEFVRQECKVEVSTKQILEDWYEHLEKFKETDFYKSYVIYLVRKYDSKTLDFDADNLRKKLYIIAEKYVCEKVKYKDFAPEVIKKLKDLNYLLGIGSISDKETFNKYNYLNKNISEKMNMFEYFDEILLYDDVQNKKPNPEVYLKLMEKLKVRPEECLVIEDSLSGVQAAKNAKLEVVNIPDIGSLKNQDEIDKITDYKLNDMKEFWDLIKDLS